jgi:D-sedoheptulose 7-phosphate isomerase
MSLTAIRDQIAASIAVKQAILADEQLIGKIERLAAYCVQYLQAGGKVIFAGNGGSFADAQHLSA